MTRGNTVVYICKLVSGDGTVKVVGFLIASQYNHTFFIVMEGVKSGYTCNIFRVELRMWNLFLVFLNALGKQLAY